MTQGWQCPGECPIHVCQRGMGHGPLVYMSSLPDQPGAPLGKLGLCSQDFNSEPSGDLPCLGLWGAICLAFFLTNRDYFRLWETLGEMAVGSGK